MAFTNCSSQLGRFANFNSLYAGRLSEIVVPYDLLLCYLFSDLVKNLELLKSVCIYMSQMVLKSYIFVQVCLLCKMLFILFKLLYALYFSDIECVSNSKTAPCASPSKMRTIAGPCFSGSNSNLQLVLASHHLMCFKMVRLVICSCLT